MAQAGNGSLGDEPFLVAAIGDDHAVAAAGEREHGLITQRPGFGEQVRNQQIVKRRDHAHVIEPHRENMHKRGHVKRRRLILDVDHVQFLRLHPTANPAQCAPAPGMRVGSDQHRIVFAPVGGTVIGKDKHFVAEFSQGARKFLRKRADTALHRRVFACDLSDSHDNFLVYAPSPQGGGDRRPSTIRYE